MYNLWDTIFKNIYEKKTKKQNNWPGVKEKIAKWNNDWKLDAFLIKWNIPINHMNIIIILSRHWEIYFHITIVYYIQLQNVHDIMNGIIIIINNIINKNNILYYMNIFIHWIYIYLWFSKLFSDACNIIFLLLLLSSYWWK